MKIKLVFFALLLTPLLLLAVPTSAQAELPPQLKYIDAQLEIFVPLVQDFQSDYFKDHGQYYQALGSHTTAPAEADAASDLTKRPTDQLTSLAPLWDKTGLPASINFAFTVNTAVTPDGPGYSVVIQTSIDKDTWQRVFDFVPGGKSVPWQILPPPELES